MILVRLVETFHKMNDALGKTGIVSAKTASAEIGKWCLIRFEAARRNK